MSSSCLGAQTGVQFPGHSGFYLTIRFEVEGSLELTLVSDWGPTSFGLSRVGRSLISCRVLGFQFDDRILGLGLSFDSRR